MNIEQFAKQAGVSLVDCEPEWGGRIGYTEKDYPNVTVCGFRTETAAYKHWMKSKFGPTTSAAVLKLLKPKEA